MTTQQQTTFDSLMKLNTINTAADAIMNVCFTFNMHIEEVMPIIIARTEVLINESKDK